MQRVRIGLTGLSCVFLLVLLAAAMFGLAPAEKGVREPLANELAAANASADDPRDPLAELGVTPGGGQDDTATATAPPPVARPTPGGAAR